MEKFSVKEPALKEPAFSWWDAGPPLPGRQETCTEGPVQARAVVAKMLANGFWGLPTHAFYLPAGPRMLAALESFDKEKSRKESGGLETGACLARRWQIGKSIRFTKSELDIVSCLLGF